MAYRHFPGAPFLFCWSEGDCVCVKELSGRVNKYECKLGIKTEPAITPFQGPDAIWCIRDAGVLYVGRNDCTFSGFLETDGLLVRYGAWDFPYKRHFPIVGQWGGFSAAVDTDDMRTIYIHDPTRAFILHEPISEDVLLERSACDAMGGLPELTIYGKGGLVDVKKQGTWVDAPKPTWGYQPVQL